MRIAAIQMRSGADPAGNLVALEPLLRAAAAAGARYVLTPEVTLLFAADVAQLRAVAAPFAGHAQLARLAALARELQLYLHVGSLPVPLADGHFANRSVLYGPDGAVLASYDKIHLFDAEIAGLAAYRESATYTAGERAVTAPLEAFTLGFSICYDLRFPALFQSLAGAGATLLAVPAAFTVPTGEAHWHVLLRARAIETGAYVIAAAQGGRHDNGRATFGHSLVVDPWGRVIAELAHDAPGVLVADIEPQAVTEARRRLPALTHARAFAAPGLQGRETPPI